MRPAGERGLTERLQVAGKPRTSLADDVAQGVVDLILTEKLALMSVSLANAEAFARYDLEFHLAIAQAAHNQVLYQVMDTLRHVLRDWFVKAFPWGDRDEIMARHQRIYDAIRARDVGVAR